MDDYDEDIAQLREIAETFDDGLETARVGSIGYEEDGGSVVRLFTEDSDGLCEDIASAYLTLDAGTGAERSKRYTVTTLDDGYQVDQLTGTFTVSPMDYGIEMAFDDTDPDWALDEAEKLAAAVQE